MRIKSSVMEIRPASVIPVFWRRRYFDPQTGYYTGFIEEAAALWESLSHPFIDGNKRTAFAAAYTFLAINGARLTASSQETYNFINGLYETDRFAFENLVPWLRKHVVNG